MEPRYSRALWRGCCHLAVERSAHLGDDENADADLDAAARVIASSVVRNAGQICYAGTRLVVNRMVADEMIERVSKLVGDVIAGPTWSLRTTLNPILSLKQREKISSILGLGIAAGAELVIGGSAIEAYEGGL